MSEDYRGFGYYLETLQDQREMLRRQRMSLILSWLIWTLLSGVGVLIQFDAFNIVLTTIILVTFVILAYSTLYYMRKLKNEKPQPFTDRSTAFIIAAELEETHPQLK
jgi:hypothetical protein